MTAVRDLIAAALEHGPPTHTVEDVLEEIRLQRAQLWEGAKSIIVTEVQDYPRARILHFWLAAGDLDEVIALSHIAMDWGRANGCERATLAGRRGWERALKSEGWNHQLVLLGRPL